MMMRKILVCVAIFFLMFGCATTKTGRKQLILLSEDQMTQMGIAAFDEVKKKVPIEKDPRINAYVNCVADAIVKVARSDTKIRDWEIVVFKDKSANAFVLPGGKIGVHTGLLQVAKTPDQLATVLGHEVGHVIARHSNERVSEALATQSGLQIIDLILGGGDSPGKQVLMGALGIGAQFGIMLPHSRAQESEADHIGILLMSQAGFDPQESIELWKNMEKNSQGEPPEFLSTHPSHKRRISDLNSLMPKAEPVFHKSTIKPKCHLKVR